MIVQGEPRWGGGGGSPEEAANESGSYTVSLCVGLGSPKQESD